MQTGHSRGEPWSIVATLPRLGLPLLIAIVIQKLSLRPGVFWNDGGTGGKPTLLPAVGSGLMDDNPDETEKGADGGANPSKKGEHEQSSQLIQTPQCRRDTSTELVG